jgi:O-antigen ligase
MYMLSGDVRRSIKILMFSAIVLFLTQSAMTFSRGGVYNAVGAAMLGGLYLLKARHLRYQFVIGAVIFVALVYYVVLPNMDRFTDGKLSARIHDADLTGRDTLISQDLEMWRENPLLGVGPGMAKAARSYHHDIIAAHTEFSRLLAEHGTFGFLAILTLAMIVIENLKQSRTAMDRAFVCAFSAWSALYMLNAAMRLVLPAFAFGLASVVLVTQRKRLSTNVIWSRARAISLHRGSA